MASNEAELSKGQRQLAAWLKRTGTGQNELGRRLGFKGDFVTKVVNGERNPGLRAALLFELACGIAPSAWLKEPLKLAA